MAKASLGGKLPDPDLNGLGASAQHYIDHPDDSVLVVARLRLRRVTTEIDTGDQTAILGVEHIESLHNHDNANFVVAEMKKACEARTGIRQIDGFESSFAAPAWHGDPETGEKFE